MRRTTALPVTLLTGVLTTFLMTVALLVAVPTAPADAATAKQKYSRAAQKATNAARANHDRVRLKGNPCLRKYARKHARRMANKENIWHQDLQVVLRGCTMTMVGENVAMGYPSGRAVVRQGWMKSPGHRRNILLPRYRLGVVEAVKGDDGRWYAVQLFGLR